MLKTLLAAAGTVALTIGLASGALADAPPAAAKKKAAAPAKAAQAAAPAEHYTRPHVGNWGGLHVGTHIGGAWSDANWQWLDGVGAGTDRLTGGFCGVSPSTFPGCDLSHSLEGGVWGGHIGLLHQSGRFVAGVELGVTSGLQLEGRSLSTVGAQDDVFHTRIKWITTVAAKLGMTIDPSTLAYVKVGYAGADVHTSVVDTVGAQVSLGGHEWHNGYMLGVGLERMVFDNVIVGIEYNFIDVGSATHARADTLRTNVVDDKVDIDPIHTITARLSFKFDRVGAPAGALK